MKPPVPTVTMPTPLQVSIPQSKSRDIEFDIIDIKPRTLLCRQPMETKPRVYAGEPLPIQPSTEAPRKARIVDRINNYGVVTFELAIGDTRLHCIGLDEVLDYVSAADLEAYECRAFEQEAELLRITHEADVQRRLERQARRREKQKRKGIEEWISVDEDEDDRRLARERSGGRARPSYKKDFAIARMRRRRRKRDPTTGELMPLSDGDTDLVKSGSSSSSNSEGVQEEQRRERVARRRGEAPGTVELELVRRRRRKRDPMTGDLLPLSDRDDGVTRAKESSSSDSREAEQRHVEAWQAAEPGRTSTNGSNVVLGKTGKPKRPRRRRHPITQELMPLGWTYDSAAEAAEKSGRDAPMPSMNRLSLSQQYEHGSDTKRRRLGDSASSLGHSRRTSARTSRSRDQSSSDEEEAAGIVKSKRATPLSAFKKHGAINLVTDDQNEDVLEEATPGQRYSASEPKPSSLRRSPGSTVLAMRPSTSRRSTRSGRSSVEELPQLAASISKDLQSRLRPSPSSSSRASPRAPAQMSPPKLSQSQPATSIMHPTAPQLSRSPSASSSSDEDGDQYVIEAILKHSLSDPRTHPSELGKKPVMLYLVKWEGWEKPSWEPITSFADRSLVDGYRRRAGLGAER